ncbi:MULTISPECIES: hypothetical protein [unclassified Neorhizobium]|uniref:hypothetical protein n=1 Tax=unclassified Neorhizobium TaxID=2629175 RepID=UPI001FF132B4|nr:MULTISPECIES: hypothetical protein [unclassified Neorhizobium]MCJ9668975.1 hypothetical protein [Neorhizobium sp. SHOUNA12B]MCJ9744929.1 hypothetical protein [Neorhizobium sp. SHOUNA12A]
MAMADDGGNPPTVDPPHPTGKALVDRLRGWLPSFDQASLAQRAPAIIAVLVLGALALWLIDPFDGPGEAETDQVAQAWNRTIGRLGIEAVYPPQEDMFVGDIYLSLKLTATGEKYAPPPDSTVFAGRGIKIGRAKREDLAQSFEKRPYRFRDVPPPPTTPPPNAAERPAVMTEAIVPQEPAGNEIDAYLTAFPGLSIKHYVETDASWWQVALGRRTGETEEISIPSPETYSIQAYRAFKLLLAFCSENQENLCRDDNARALMAISFGDEINEMKDSEYIYEPYVSLVRQVFVTRKIEISRYRGDSLTARASRQQAEESAEDKSKGEGGTSSTGTANDRLVHEGRYSTRLNLDQTFARPVTFGFRRIALTVKPAPQAASPTK